MRQLFLFLLIGGLFGTQLSSCASENFEPDSNLFGVWSDDLVRYRFHEDLTFTVAYKRTPEDPAQLDEIPDSVWGTYRVEQENNKIFLEGQGFRDAKNGQLVEKLHNRGIWDYEIKNDTVLNYTTQTTVGKLFRQR